MSRWFRHYAGMMRDEKLVRVAIKSKQPIERVLWVWGAILESAAEIDEEGRYDLDAAEVAYFLRTDEDDVGAILASLADAGRVAGTLVVNWGDRQFSSDRSKDRQAAYRERKRAEKGGSEGKNGHANDRVTSPSRHDDNGVTAQETEAETEDLEPDGSRASGDAPEGANDDEVEDKLRPEHIVAKWNELAPSMGKPTVRDLTPERRQLLKARIGQYAVDDFVTVFGNIRGSPFLRGDTGKQFCTFDWAMKKANFQKILEGNYAHG